jgi:hydrogenase maturation protease
MGPGFGPDPSISSHNMIPPILPEILKSRPLLLLGMGNPMRGDDAIGHILAEALEPLNGEGFQVHAVGTAVENAMRWIRETAGGTILLIDAVFDESIAEGSWGLYPADQLDSMCHSTHSIPLSMLIYYWQKEVPDLHVHFLGISIRSNTEMAPLSPALQQAFISLKSGIEEMSAKRNSNVPGNYSVFPSESN